MTAPTPRVRTRIRSDINPAAVGAPTHGVSTAIAPQGDGDTSWMKAGADARATTAAETARQQKISEERAARGYVPQRFGISQVPSQADIVILDRRIEHCFWEHDLTFEPAFKTQRRNSKGLVDIFEPCARDVDLNCPLCDTPDLKSAYYAIFLTVIELLRQPYQAADGRMVQNAKRVLCVKNRDDHGFFYRLEDRMVSEGKDLRGVHLIMSRDSNRGARIGRPEFHMRYEEEQIMQAFGHPPVLGRPDGPMAGKVVKEANADCYPIDYGRVFVRPSAAAIRAKYPNKVVGAPAGSAEANAGEWAGHDPGQAPAPVPAAGGIALAAGTAPVPAVAPTTAPAPAPVAAVPTSAPARAAPAPAGGDIAHTGAVASAGMPPADLDDEIPF